KKKRWPEVRRVSTVSYAEYLRTPFYMYPAQTDSSLCLVEPLKHEREPSGHLPIIQAYIVRPPSNIAVFRLAYVFYLHRQLSLVFYMESVYRQVPARQGKAVN